MKDNFSVQASGYAKFRPHYPAEMIQYIIGMVAEKNTALDVATGNGQVALALAPFFNKVYATDISEKQLQHAEIAPSIYYSVASAENLGFEDGSFDLITVGQAIHWFNFDAFYKEVKRLLKPDGVFAVLGYGFFSAGEEAEKVLRYLYKDVLGEYWDAERKYVDENYRTIPFSFKEIQVKGFENRFKWSLEQVLGYLNTWSAVQHYIKDKGENPIDLIKPDLQKLWGGEDKAVIFPLLLRIGKNF
jgi:ubiquinone/menaquinone biosynthesis C-methylase UbiE